jgi:lipopolysaccharide exporter
MSEPTSPTPPPEPPSARASQVNLPPATAQQAARGAAWMIATSLGARIVGVLGTLVIARFLEPEIVGEVSVASVMCMTATWATTWGFGSYAVVYGRGDDARQVTWHATVAYFVLGLVALAAVFGLAEPVTAALGAPEADQFIPGLAIAVFIRRMGAMPERVLSRSMRFRPLGLSNALGEITFAITAVSLAANGWGGDAIVIGNLVQSSVTVSLLIRSAGVAEWATPAKLQWSRYRDMLRFGLPLAVQSFAHNAARYWDNLTVSYLFGEKATGTYNYAYNLADIPATYIGEQLALVLLPSMASLPPERRPRALERSTALLSLIIFPLAIGLGLISEPLIALIFSDEWQGVAPLLTVLTVLSVFRPITWVLGAYLEAQDRTRRLMFLELAKVVVLISGLFALQGFGLHWAAASVGIAYGLNAVAGVWMVLKEGPSPRRLLLGFIQPLIACGVMAVAVMIVRHYVAHHGYLIVQLIAEIGTGVVVYVATALVVCRATTRDLLGLLKHIVQRRRGR